MLGPRARAGSRHAGDRGDDGSGDDQDDDDQGENREPVVAVVDRVAGPWAAVLAARRAWSGGAKPWEQRGRGAILAA